MQVSAQQIDAILASMGEGILVVDRKYKIVLMNDAAGFMLRIAPVTAIGKNLLDVFKFYKEGVPESSSMDLLRKAMKEINIRRIRMTDNYYYKDKEGDKYALTMVITTLIVGDKISGVVIMFRDASLEKQIDRAKSEFLDFASHQLRTPLSAVNWYTELLLNEDFGAVNKEQKDCLEEIDQAGQKMSALITIFLNTSRIELGLIAINPQSTQLSDLLDDVIKEMRPRLIERKQKLQRQYTKIQPIKIDTKIMRMVLQNLISNAIKYSPEKSKIVVGLSRESARVVIKVSDAGYGIPKDQVRHIFEKGFRATNVEDRDIEGHGFGLYIVKELLDDSGGEIWFQSNKNQGTTFFVGLPLDGMKKRKGIKHLD